MNAYSLICHRDVDQALKCLGSFVEMTRDDIDLHLFDDGSLTAEDCNVLCERLKIETSAIHRIRDIPALDGYPNLQRAREQFVMCRKLLDIPLLDDQPKLILDTDILFLRPFSGILSASQQSQFVCMRDQQSAYSPSLLDRMRLRLSGHPLISHANAGILLADPAIIDLDLLEFFFSQPKHLRFPALVEQTAWALLGSKVENPCYWSPAAVDFPPQDLNANPDSIAWHFASDYRHLLAEAECVNADTAAVSLTTQPAKAISLAEELVRAKRNAQAKLSKP